MEDRRRESLVGGGETKPSYKVVHELVTREKRELKTQTTENHIPPSGYTFVPVGIPELAEFCKEQSRESGRLVYIVNAGTRNGQRSKYLELDRIGYHFENSIAAKGSQWVDLQHGRNGPYVRKTQSNMRAPAHLTRRLESQGRRMKVPTKNPSRQQLLQQVRETILELFPKIPAEDLDQVVQRAFAEGTDTVGNATDMPLAKKVQLAVNAHIRHMHTPYDFILKAYRNDPQRYGNDLDPDPSADRSQDRLQDRSAIRAQARFDIEDGCLHWLRKWRGEERGGSKEFEEIFKEIIVIDDDSDDDIKVTGTSKSNGRGARAPQHPHTPSHSDAKPRRAPEIGLTYRKRGSGAGAYSFADARRDEGGEREPPGIQEPQRISAVLRKSPELVHVRPKRTIPSSQLSNMDSLASNRIQQVRTPGSGLPPQMSPTAHNSSHGSPILNSGPTSAQFRPDSVLTSIETGNTVGRSASGAKRKAIPEKTSERQRKVYVIDEVPESDIVYRGSKLYQSPQTIQSNTMRASAGNQHRLVRSNLGDPNYVVRPSAENPALRPGFSTQSWKVVLDPNNNLPDDGYENNGRRTIHDRRYAPAANETQQMYDVDFRQSPDLTQGKVFYELPSHTDVDYSRPVQYRELPMRYNELPVTYKEIPVEYSELPVEYSELPIEYEELPIEYLQPRGRYRYTRHDDEYL